VVLIVVLVLVSILAKVPASLYPKKLSHTAVEKYIARSFTASEVKCNDGKNFKIKKNASFICTAAQGESFTVKLTNGDGRYEVTKRD
jgi:hypothetical protein